MSRRTSKPFRNDRVHVVKEKCSTCIFHPGNRAGVLPGVVKKLVERATEKESCITCHSTIHGDQAVCRGFFDSHKTLPLQLAERMGLVEFVDVTGH